MSAASSSLDELCDDARAYLRVGDVEAAIAVLFEGLRTYQSEETRTGAARAVENLCESFWAAGNRDGGTRAARAAVGQILKHAKAPPEPELVEVYIAALAETGASPLAIKRLYRQSNLLRIFRGVLDGPPGDIAECGCARGMSSFQLCLIYSRAHPGWQGETFHVFDSFEGLSPAGEEDAVDTSTDFGRHIAANLAPRQFAVAREIVERNLHRLFPRVTLNGGWIPQVFAGQPEREYRFVHVDVDLYQPTKDSLGYFFPRLAPGGIVISDDYDWPGARKAFQEFAGEHGLELRTTDTSQAYFVKERGAGR